MRLKQDLVFDTNASAPRAEKLVYFSNEFIDICLSVILTHRR